jgi:hypothetical protein
MKRKKLFLLLTSAVLIVSADLAYLYGRGGGGGGGGRGGGGFGGARGGGSFGGGGGRYAGAGNRSALSSRSAARPAASRPSAGSRAAQGNRNVTRNTNRNWNGNRGGYGHYGYGHGGYGYWGGGYGGWGWGAFGLGLYLPLTFAAAYGISNQGGGDTTTIVNNYPAEQNYPQQDAAGEYVPQVPSDAVYISPEMMQDPKVQRALEAMRNQQGSEDESTTRALKRAKTAMAAS